MITIKSKSELRQFKEIDVGVFFVYNNHVYQKTAAFSCLRYQEGTSFPIPTFFSEEYFVKKINVNITIEIIPDA